MVTLLCARTKLRMYSGFGGCFLPPYCYQNPQPSASVGNYACEGIWHHVGLYLFFCKDLIHKAVQFKSRHFAWPDAWCALLVVPTLSQSLLFERFRIHVQTCTWFPKDCTPCTASCTFPSAVHVNCASKSAHEYTRGSQKRLKSSVIWSQMTVCEPCKKYHVNRRCKTDLGAVCLMCLSPSLF